MAFYLTPTGLLFHKAFPPKVVNWETDSGVIRLPCRIMGAGRTLPSIFFLKNGVRIPSASTGGVRIEDVSSNNRRGVLVVEEKRGNEGIYQCVGQAGEDGSTALTTSTYINIQCELIYDCTYVHVYLYLLENCSLNIHTLLCIQVFSN